MPVLCRRLRIQAGGYRQEQEPQTRAGRRAAGRESGFRHFTKSDKPVRHPSGDAKEAAGGASGELAGRQASDKVRCAVGIDGATRQGCRGWTSGTHPQTLTLP